jgi:ATP-dependent Lon protease
MSKDNSDSPKKSMSSKLKKKKHTSSDEESDIDIIEEDEYESEDELPKSGTKEFSKMVRSLGRRYQTKKDEESRKKKKKPKNSNKSLKDKDKNKKKKYNTRAEKKKSEELKEKNKKRFLEHDSSEEKYAEKLHKKKKSRGAKIRRVHKCDIEEEEEDETDEEYHPDEESFIEEDEEEDEEEMDKEMLEYLEKLEREGEDDLHSQAREVLDKQFNIIFTTGGGLGMGASPFGEESESESDEDEEVIISSDEEEEKKSDDIRKDKSTSLKKGDRVKVELKDWDKPYFGIILKIKNKTEKKNKKTAKFYDIQLDEDDDDCEEFETCLNIHEKRISPIVSREESDCVLKELESLIKAKNTGGDKDLLNKYYQMVDEKKKLDKVAKDKQDEKKKISNLKKFKKLLRGNSALNEFKYFKTLSTQIQKKIMKKLKEVNDYSKVEKPHKLSLIEAEIPVRYKSTAMKKLETLKWMDPGSGEYYKIKQWVDTFMKIPFNKYNNLPVSLADGEDKYNEFMENAKTTLDEAVYGMDDAKMQIMQLVGQWISNPQSIGTAIAIGGPPGTGKTTLLKEGVSKILNRPFSFLALGGATDSSFLEGHSYTYEGSVWGRVVDIIINSKCMNPVIYFDELDKISNTPKGEEIVGILTHLTDTAQNDKFHDKYFSGIDFDLSKVLFIFSYNDETKINPILRDRMYRINTEGYKKTDKCVISQKYLLPTIIKTLNFTEGDIIIPNETVGFISENLIQAEKGVRNLKRALEIIYTKLNLYRLMKKDSKLFEKETTFEVKFPFTVTIDIAKKLVKKDDRNGIPLGMYV